MDLTWTLEHLPLRVPLRISRASVAVKEAVVVALEHDVLVGFGEATATSYYRQSVDSIVETLAMLRRLLIGLRDPFDALAELDGWAEQLADQPVTVAALDAAVHDWIGKRLELPMWRYLGLRPGGVRQTAFTVGIDAPDAAAAAARGVAENGCTILKLKVGLPSADDERDLVAAVRRAAPTATLYLDANGGWPVDDAERRIDALLPFAPALIEQPIAPGQPECLRRMRGHVPIIADEDARTPCDVPRLWGAVDGINVKLAKCGGVRQALAMVHAARAAGMQVMLGCVVSSSLGLAPSVMLAPLADYLDLDGHLLLANDPWTGLGDSVALLPSEASGLGVQRRHIDLKE
jgi:L-alanine-DL-glutamate epimerase-like enolase superfamily enzyme